MSARGATTAARSAALAAALLAVAATDARAQSLAARVAALPDGPAQATYATRPEACGNGRDVVSLGDFITASGSFEGRGWSNAQCAHGPARLLLTVQNRQVTDVRVSVGPRAAGPASGARDLGVVSAADAADLALTLAGRLAGRAAGRAVVAAAVADSADVWRRLLALARGGAAEERTRRTAMHWLAAVAPPEAVPTMVGLVRDANESRVVREGAVSVLALARDGAGVPALVGVSRSGADAWLREKAVFWLGQAHDPRARAELRTLAASDTADERAREQAIFALSQDDDDQESGAFIRGLYPRLTSARLRDKAIMSVAQLDDDAAGRRWLLDLAASSREPVEARKQALFWAGQRDETPIAELVAVYPRLSETELRKHFTFVLSQRDEDAAVEKLIDVARRDADRDVRRQALFWLGQSRNPRAQRYLVEVIER